MSLYIPKVIGHRGAKDYAPENTLSSLHTAADMGIEWIEADVMLTKDGTAVIFHDLELERTTNGSGLVSEITWQDMSELDAGLWFGESFMGERVPTLEQFIDAALERGLGLDLEIKPAPGSEIETAEVALDIASRLWPDDKPPPLISSFQNVSLETALDMIPEWPRGLAIDDMMENWREMAEYLQVATIIINGNKVTPEQIDDFIGTQLPVIAYTINDPSKAKELLQLGVDTIISDCPDVILEAIETKH